MKPGLTLAAAAALLPGSKLIGDGATRLARVHSDSRSLRPGDLFVALVGERFDGHDYLVAARDAGATAALASRGLSEAGLPGLQVEDTLAALQQLAAGWRSSLDLPLIAVTGSNGKTTVTQMIAAILQAWLGDAALATAGNFNNHIGVPLTLLRLRDDDGLRHRAAVLELGMNHAGEIAQLAAIAAPTVALVNNAQREHQEFMAGVEAVARENGAVIQALPASGVAVFPADDAHTPLWREWAGSRPTLAFALRGPGDLVGDGRWSVDHWAMHLRTPAGLAEFALHAAGEHNVRNALAAAASALAAGAPLDAIVAGLQRFRPVKGRSQSETLNWRGTRATLVDDSYNANPDSVRAAIGLLAGLPGPHWLILGDMGEVGEQGPAFHDEVGRFAVHAGIAQVWTVGLLASHSARGFGPAARHFGSTDALIEALATAGGFASVLVKGSRFMAMERVVAALRTGADALPIGGPDAA
jgi:UDP-N-acetylmuramoyl-tripeptide--D-alanyl-D-alanine ligase